MATALGALFKRGETHVIILDGKPYDVPGVVTISWLDDPRRVPRITNVTRRDRRVRMIFPHTVWGYSGVLRSGKGASRLFAWTRSQSNRKGASWDYTVGKDGVVACQNDVVTHYSWHATHPNPLSMSIEMEQDEDGTQYQACIDATCRLIVFLCEALGVQKQLPWDPRRDGPYVGHLSRLDPERAGEDCVGVMAHRHVWHYPKGSSVLVPERGPGDPGDYVFEALVREHQFERLVYHGDDPEDLRVWKARQMLIGVASDGIPLTQTTARLQKLGYRNGLWVDAPPADVP